MRQRGCDHDCFESTQANMLTGISEYLKMMKEYY